MSKKEFLFRSAMFAASLVAWLAFVRSAVSTVLAFTAGWLLGDAICMLVKLHRRGRYCWRHGRGPTNEELLAAARGLLALGLFVLVLLLIMQGI